MSASFENDPEFNDTTPKPNSGRSFTLSKLLMIVTTIAVLSALSLPAYTSARRDARRAWCKNNLKQIALALHNYEQDHKALPPAYTTDANGRPLHSWRTLILPYLEQKSLYEKIDLSKPWNDPVNATASATNPDVFICPEFVDTKNTTAYLAVVGPDGFLVPGRPRRFEEITDGLASTLAVIEASEEDAVPWMAPFDADAFTVMKLDTKAKLHHAGGTNAAMADGSVRFLKADTPAPVRRALLSISGNDNDAVKEW
jgi:prepilin-type processing-associated H-X9-DG protein